MLRRLLVVSGLVGVVAATAIGARASASSEAMKSIVAAYLEIQTQLVADKTDTVKTEAHTIGARASARREVRLRVPPPMSRRPRTSKRPERLSDRLATQ